MKSQTTSKIFWTLYQEHSPSETTTHVPEECLRHQCILGLTSLDAAIYTYWTSHVLPEWNDFMSLVNSYLENDAELETLLNKVRPHLKKSQLVATLRFIHNTGNEARFTPTFLDFAVYLMSTKGDSVWSSKLYTHLIALNKYRNNAFHTGKNWDISIAKECIKEINACSASLINLGKSFADIFSEDIRDAKVISLKNAA